MATLTVYKTTESQDLGPGSNLTIKVAGKEVFLLKSEDQIALQEYVDTGVRLPTSDSELRMLLKYKDDQREAFVNLIHVYTEIYKHCSDFRSNVYPKSVKTASDLYAYAVKVPGYYDDFVAIFQDYVDGKMSKADAKAEITDLVKSLMGDINSHIDAVEKVHTAIQTFDTDTLTDQGRLKQAVTFYSDTFKLNDENILAQQAAIDNLKNEIESVKAEYTQSVIIASTTPIYAWIPFFGYIIGSTVAGIYGAKAVELDKKIAALKTELETKSADVQLRSELKGTLSLVNENLAEVSKKCNAALEALGRIKTVWTNLDAALGRVPTGLDDIDAKETLRALKRAVDAGKEEWDRVGTMADNYVATAYIKLENTNLPQFI